MSANLHHAPITLELRITIQLVSFAGPGMACGYESGNRSALEGLASHLAPTAL